MFVYSGILHSALSLIPELINNQSVNVGSDSLPGAACMYYFAEYFKGLFGKCKKLYGNEMTNYKKVTKHSVWFIIRECE